MSGHSHWATIKHKKGAADAKKGKMFSKLAKYIITAARNGGGDLDSNFKLRDAVEKARAVSMPRDNIERAIRRGSGAEDGIIFEELTYECYAPGGVAILVDILTDNRNRTSAELRKIVERAGGSMGAVGSVAWLFEKKALVTLEKSLIDEDHLLELALDAGATDVVDGGELWEVTGAPEDLRAIKEALTKKGLALKTAEVAKVPKTYVPVDAARAQKILNFLEDLEDHDDVQSVSANPDMPEGM